MQRELKNNLISTFQYLYTVSMWRVDHVLDSNNINLSQLNPNSGSLNLVVGLTLVLFLKGLQIYICCSYHKKLS